ncbi:class I SAM-dependent methyltransferase [Paenibacillus sediminis]|uniref:Ubiquinone/menaquinone biosynthesis C-methylase UbiE n=1 Tax=Paenibacillus sediminis TaxID=664909 RepID=A0ABS4H3F6_9BACL|nr:class I SAM-dependent methyltransferase [Paenibacillus sediminis]MBP1936817.1 ubiquinone/menaquinone biosynthesis C-methylase UbiE [Paenibacillus sediminis]
MRRIFTLKYGIDAPFWVGFLTILGLVLTVISCFGLPQSILGVIFGGFMFVEGVWMFLYSTVIKIRHRHVIIDLAEIKQGDKVLDVGTGRGLLAIAAAMRGAAVTAIDKWSAWDLSGNGRQTFEDNRISEGVPRIELLDGDVQDLPYQDETFDAVISNFVIHNIKKPEERKTAVEQMWRVLKKGGVLVISDIAKINEYTEILRNKTAEVKVQSIYYTFPFSKIVVAHKK